MFTGTLREPRVAGATVALATSRHLENKLTPYFKGFQLRQRVRRKPGEDELKTILETAL